jgi:hypothetical protein
MKIIKWKDNQTVGSSMQEILFDMGIIESPHAIGIE